jgi:hypothetical protein
MTASARRLVDMPGYGQLNAKNLYISAVTRKLSLVFFLYDRLSFRHLYAVSFPHEEGVCERFFIQLTEVSANLLYGFGQFNL